MKSVYSSNVSIVLASGSPRRRQFLEELGILFSVEVAEHAEPVSEIGEDPLGYAKRAALAKTEAVAQNRPDSVVIGADTIVVLNNEIMGKPRDEAHALSMLSRLVGNSHEVITGVCVASPMEAPHVFAVSTTVTMFSHDVDVLQAYIRTGEPSDKAGAYAIQGIGAFLVESIAGSWSNVVGLPVVELVTFLQQKNILSVAR